MKDEIVSNLSAPSHGEESAFHQPVIRVRAGADPEAPHLATLSIGDWQVPCVVGCNGLVAPQLKREGDGCTPIGCFPLRYGFYDPAIFGDEPGAFAFPFKEKPANYNWSEEASGRLYNRFLLDMREEAPSRLGERLFDLFVPLGWNDATPALGGGSAIFLHAAREDFSGTAGCVAVAHEHLLELARRLEPGMVIDIAPADMVGVEDALALPLLADGPDVETLETVTFRSLRPGPKLLITGAVHGNEPCGTRAITRAIAAFKSGHLRLTRGSVTFVPVMNPLAWRRNQREGMRNLNRNFSEKTVPEDFEDRLCNVICPILRDHDVLIDLHSFTSEGEPLALFGPSDNDGVLEPFAHADAELALASAMGLGLMVHGWMEAFDKAIKARKKAAGAAAVRDTMPANLGVGTTEYMRFAGGYGITVECGNHNDPASAAVAWQCILNGLAHLDMINFSLPAERPKPRVYEMMDAILAEHADDRLVEKFTTGAEVREGQVIGHRASGEEIRAPYDGALIFSDISAAPNTELTFVCRKSQRFAG
nr:succinylglutamate desuccinylase/aspartoacylase family protein [uncultured Cohaesibacter sp.]